MLFQSNGIIKEFDENGFLINQTDRNKNRVIIKRSGQQILYVENSFGEHLDFEYKNGFITKISNARDPTENVVYTYNGTKLESVKDVDGDSVLMRYDSNNRLICLEKCDGSKVLFNYGLVTSDGKILTTSTTNEEGSLEYFEYDRINKRTLYIDHDKNQTLYEYDEKHRTRQEIKPDGSIIKYNYDDQGNLDFIDENGNITSYTYDAAGRKLRADYSDNSYEIWTYDEYGDVLSYRDRDGVNLSYVRDARGNLIEYRIDNKPVLNQIVDSRGLVISQTVYGQRPVTTSYEYDDYGNLTASSCGGIKTKYTYDNLNRIKTVAVNNLVMNGYEYIGRKIICKSYGGLVTTYITNGRKDLIEIIQKDNVTEKVHKIRLEYDKRHLPLRVFVGDGLSDKLMLSYQYTAEGKLCAQIRHGKECWVTVYDYEYGEISQLRQFKTTESTLNNLSVLELAEKNASECFVQKYRCQSFVNNEKRISVTDALGTTSLYEYDRYGNLIRTVDGNGQSNSLVYTKAGRLLGEQSAFGGWYEYSWKNGLLITAGEKDSEKNLSEYNPDGSLARETNRYGKVTEYNYDNCGRVSSILSESKKLWYEYDFLGRIIKQVVGNSSDEKTCEYFVTYQYSSDGRKITRTEGGKYKTIFELDAFENIISETDGNGNTRRYEYDSQNNMIAAYDGYDNKTVYEYDALGNVSKVITPEGGQTKYCYNNIGLLEKITDDCGTVYSAEYDKAGRLIKEQSRAQSEKEYEYDRGGRVTKVLCGGEIIEQYSYGNDNRCVTVKDGIGNVYLYNYDAFGRLTDEHNRNALVQQYSFDEEGQIKSQSSFDGSVVNILYSSDRTKQTVRYSDGTEKFFVYDSLGNITLAQNVNSKTTYVYDRGGKLIYQKDEKSGEEIRYEYDNAGNRILLSGANREIHYLYGKNNEIKEIFDNLQNLRVQLSYNKNGREVLRRFANGTEEHTLYDKAERVILKTQKSSDGRLLWGEGYVYGTDGKRSATVDNLARVTLYEYNRKGELSAVWYPFSSELLKKISSEALENGLGSVDVAGENRFLSSAQKSELSSLLNAMQYGLSYNLTAFQSFIGEKYSYDKNGNRLSKTNPFGTIEYSYDKENRLVASGSRGKTFINYEHDNAGNLLSVKSDQKLVLYAYDAQNRLIYSRVTDEVSGVQTNTSYAYDAFSRRVLVQDEASVAIRSVYDGFSFDVIKQSSVSVNGNFYSSYNANTNGAATGIPTGDRYRYLEDDNADGNRYFYLDEQTRTNSTSRYTGSRFAISINGTIAAQSTSDGQQYFTTDLLDSVTNVTDSFGYQLDFCTYDAFGSLVHGSLSGAADFGYLGKQYESTTSLYNYGYRDYSPLLSRFTTPDPLRDGPNWFTYVHNDPINFVDLWGLEASDPKVYGRVNSKDVKGQFIFFSVSKSKEVMDVYVSRDSSGQRVEKLVSFSVVTNVQAGKKDATKKTDISRTQGNGTNPTQVANGIYLITTARAPSTGDGKYGTGNQGLVVGVGQDLKNVKNDKYVTDYGYMIHITPYNYTNGCIGIKYDINDEVSKQAAIQLQMLLVSLYEESINNGYNTYIEYKY